MTKKQMEPKMKMNDDEMDAEAAQFAVEAFQTVDCFLSLLKQAIPVANIAIMMTESFGDQLPKECNHKKVLKDMKKWHKTATAVVKKWDYDESAKT